MGYGGSFDNGFSLNELNMGCGGSTSDRFSRSTRRDETMFWMPIAFELFDHVDIRTRSEIKQGYHHLMGCF